MIDLIIGFIEIGVGVMLIEFNYMFNLGISLLILGGFYIGKRILSRKGKIVMSEEERKAIEYYQDKEVSFTLENFDFGEFKKALGITEEDSFEKHQIRFKTLINLIETQNKMIELMAEEIKEITGSCPLDIFDYDLDCENKCEQGIDGKCWAEYFRNEAKESE